MANHWYYFRDNEQQGPVSDRQLKEMAASGQLTPEDAVWKEGMTKWMKARSIKGLFPTLAAVTPPPLPQAIPISEPVTTPPPSEPPRIVSELPTIVASAATPSQAPQEQGKASSLRTILFIGFVLLGIWSLYQKVTTREISHKKNTTSEFADTNDWYFQNDWWAYRMDNSDPVPADKGLLHTFNEIPEPVQQAIKDKEEVWHVPEIRRTTYTDMDFCLPDMDIYLIATGTNTGVVVCANHITNKKHGDLNWWESWITEKVYKNVVRVSAKETAKKWNPEWEDFVLELDIKHFWSTHIDEGRCVYFRGVCHDQNWKQDETSFLITIKDNGSWDSLFTTRGITETSEVRRGVAERLR